VESPQACQGIPNTEITSSGSLAHAVLAEAKYPDYGQLSDNRTTDEHDHIHEGYPMSVIDCDYLPADKVVFPPELALLIVRKAAAMAAAFEEQAQTSSLRTPGERLLKALSLGESSGKCVCNRPCRTTGISVVFSTRPGQLS